ncbi:hypothetical protein EON65_36005 [archaeon]|nr:MAG: hypothetical protein EON65_36005 [archaeon]
MSYNQVTTANQSFLELGLAVLLRRTSLSEQIDVSHYLTSCIDGILSSKTTERHQYYQLLSFYLQQCQAIEYPKLLQSIERGNILIETARPSDYSTLPVFLHYLASVNDKHPELKANWTKNMSKIVQTCLRVYSKNKDSCEVTGFVLDILQALLTSDNDTLVLPHTNQLQEICLQIIFPSSSSAVGTVRSQRCVDLSVSVYTLLLSHCNLERYAEALKNLIGIYYGVLVQLDYPKMSINKKITSSMWVGGLSGRKGSEGQGMQKAKHYREIFLRATKVLVMVRLLF